jgi:hypothetical protein
VLNQRITDAGGEVFRQPLVRENVRWYVYLHL